MPNISVALVGAPSYSVIGTASFRSLGDLGDRHQLHQIKRFLLVLPAEHVNPNGQATRHLKRLAFLVNLHLVPFATCTIRLLQLGELRGMVSLVIGGDGIDGDGADGPCSPVFLTNGDFKFGTFLVVVHPGQVFNYSKSKKPLTLIDRLNLAVQGVFLALLKGQFEGDPCEVENRIGLDLVTCRELTQGLIFQA